MKLGILAGTAEKFDEDGLKKGAGDKTDAEG